MSDQALLGYCGICQKKYWLAEGSIPCSYCDEWICGDCKQGGFSCSSCDSYYWTCRKCIRSEPNLKQCAFHTENYYSKKKK